MEENEKLHRFFLSQIKGVGVKKYLLILEKLGSAQNLWNLTREELISNFGENFGTKLYVERDAIDTQKLISYLEKQNLQYKVLGEEDYPFLLSQISDPPMYFFYSDNADFSILSKAITIVGTRRATNYSENILKTFIPQLVEEGFTVVSGLASGVDEIAHRLTLSAKGKTVAVLGSSLDNPTPKSNLRLYEKIIESRGIVISEELPGSPVMSTNFPRRNRILAGLSASTLVVEASERSGALITAHLAFDYNRQVFAIPGSLNQKQSIGCNHIIKIERAKLVQSVQDIFDELGIKSQSNEKIEFHNLDQLEKKIVSKLMVLGPTHPNKLSKIIDTYIAELLASLMKLELKGIVVKSKNDEYSMRI